MTVLHAQEVRLAYGGVVAIDGVDLRVEPGTIHAVIGPNGAGKTSLLNVCSGVTRPDSGRIHVDGTDVTGRGPTNVSRAGMARTFQNIQLFPYVSAMENVVVGASAKHDVDVISALLGLPRSRRMERAARERAHDELEFVGLAARASDLAGSLPYGNQRLLEIARALATEPRVLLLDEPGAGFNSEEKHQLGTLIGQVRDRGVAVVIVEHDMDLVMAIAEQITVVNFGRQIAEGTPEQIQANPVVIDAYLGAPDDED